MRTLFGVLLLASWSSAVSAQTPAAPQPAAPSEAAASRAPSAASWTFGVRPNGGGFFATSPDGKYDFRLLGYAQAVGTLVNADFSNTFGSSDFRVRRARVGWAMTFDKKYEVFIEYDGVPQTGNLVEARLNAKLIGDDLQVRAGKFVVPFSEEGWRSSRNYDTIERFIVVNSLYGLPALDTQIGVMLHGQLLSDNKLTWYAGVWNGNASAAENNRDNNSDKEFQAKATYRFTPAFRAGLGFDHTAEETQTLRLNSLTGTRFAATDVRGTRSGLDGDFFYEKGALSFRGEALTVSFDEADATLRGGFVQAAYFTKGNYDGGIQPLVRLETARMGAPHGDSTIDALTLGVNWYLSNHVRLQVNALAERFGGVGGLAVEGDGIKPSLLTELQLRF